MKRIRLALRKFFKIKKLFSRIIILGCLGYMIRVTERVLDITENGIDCYGILAAAGAVFGGELLLLAFKDVIAEKVRKKLEEERDC